MKRTFQIISFAIGAAVLSGCATLPETTRSAVNIEVPQAASISALQRQFQAQTPHVVNFGFDEDTLDDEAIAKLEQQAAWILAHPNIKFRVHGHTDRVGNVAYNQDLGLRRATRVVDYLIAQGIEAERLEAVVSFGEELPMVDTEDRERQNRRTVTEVYEYLTLPPRQNAPEDDLVASIITTDGPGPISEDPTPSNDPEPTDDTPTGDDTPTDNDTPSGDDSSTDTKTNNSDSKNHNSGRGNGDETGDPGNSEGKNKGGDI